MPLRWYTLVFLAIANFLSYKLFRLDAHRAFRAQKRVPDTMLEVMILAGGEIGAILALAKYGTKRKQTYIRITSFLVLFLQLAFLVLYILVALKTEGKISELTVNSIFASVTKFISTL